MRRRAVGGASGGRGRHVSPFLLDKLTARISQVVMESFKNTFTVFEEIPFFSGSFNSSMVHSQLSGNWLREMMSSSGMMSSSRSPGKAGSQLSLEQARFSCCSLDTRLYRPGGAPSTETPPWPCDDFGGPGHVCLSGLLPPQKHEKILFYYCAGIKEKIIQAGLCPFPPLWFSKK